MPTLTHLCLRYSAGIAFLIVSVELSYASCEHQGFKHNSWLLGPGWSERNGFGGAAYFLAEYQGDSYSWLTNRVIEESWSVTLDFDIQELFASGGARGSASLALAIDQRQPQLRSIIEVNRHRDGFVLLEIFHYDSELGWRTMLSSGWRRSSDTAFRLNVARLPGSPVLTVGLTNTLGNLLFQGSTTSVPFETLELISALGIRVVGSKTAFTHLSIDSPLVVDKAPANHFRNLATCAATDLLGHFWKGAYSTGEAVSTWNGYTGSLPDPRGVLWERAMLLFVFDTLERATGNDRWRQRIAADWRRTTLAYSATELEACGTGTANPACDDAGWSALMYLVAYRATSDSAALARAHGIVSNAFSRWMDAELGGGMWYNDSRSIKSLYQTALILAALRIYGLSGNVDLRDKALACAEGIESHLLRNDGLYWCDYDSSGPIGSERPYDIHEASSVTSLGGNMAMGIIHAWRYRESGDETYRSRAMRTANAISTFLTVGGVLLNDRDAWTQGTFATDWAAEVLTLPGLASSHWQLLRSTAQSIAVNSRTYFGYYGGSWSGPAEGEGSRWWLALSRPQQIMTSASSVAIIAATALLETHDLAHFRPSLSIVRGKQATQLKLTGTPRWTYVLESSVDLATWITRNVVTMNVSRTNLLNLDPSTKAAEFYRAGIYFDP